jgi:nitroimidazol reductase NimA-like FMN-containing flavoprotein (pyridoxamine 5'-phosphate oxidase superfamily)
VDEALKQKILDVFQSQHVMAIATVRPDGFPQTTWVNYINDGLTLYFASDAASQKIGNIRLCDKVSAAIADETQNFNKLRSVSLAGRAARVRDAATADDVALRLFKRLPQSRKFVPKDPASLAIVKIMPVAISLIDYSEGYGTSRLLEL